MQEVGTAPPPLHPPKHTVTDTGDPEMNKKDLILTQESHDATVAVTPQLVPKGLWWTHVYL